MRHKGVNKEETRAKIIDASSRGFRKNGYAGIGVDGLAQLAGVTSGAFYAHMKSKNAAFQGALNIGLRDVIDAIPKLQKLHGAQWVEVFVEYYFSKSHREDMECGCAMASLTPEVVRAEDAIHVAFEEQMDVIIGLIAQGLDGGSAQERRTRAISLLGLLIGGLNLLRAMSSDAMKDEVGASIKPAVIMAAGKVRITKN